MKVTTTNHALAQTSNIHYFALTNKTSTLSEERNMQPHVKQMFASLQSLLRDLHTGVCYSHVLCTYLVTQNVETDADSVCKVFHQSVVQECLVCH